MTEYQKSVRPRKPMSNETQERPVGYLELRKWIKQRNQGEEISRKQLIQLEQSMFHDLLKDDGICEKCGRTDRLTLDHIVPKSILLCFGIDVMREMIEGNYQLLCKSCNIYKSGRLDFSIPATKEILLKLLERV